jgi:hypothetical protein
MILLHYITHTRRKIMLLTSTSLGLTVVETLILIGLSVVVVDIAVDIVFDIKRRIAKRKENSNV